VVTTDTLAPLTKCGAVDGFERASNLCVALKLNVPNHVLTLIIVIALTRLKKPE
jgi:hypothetical protein